MAKTFLTVLFLFLVAAGQAAASDSVNVRVNVKGLRSDSGLCRLLLFGSKRGFPESTKDAVAMQSETIRSEAATFTLRVKAGHYAVAILHDENANGHLDKTWYGKPKEGFGSSNNPRVGLGPPGFDESAVLLDETNDQLTITLNYF